jgi:hypothetical protein
MAKYKIRLGESLIDVCYNTTGAMSSIDAVMDANDITTYTPDLVPDTEITVPDVVYNSEAVQVANTRPFTSICAVDDAEIDAMIAELVTELEPPASTPSVTISPESPWTSDAQAVTITNNGNVSLSVISLPDFISKPTLPYALGIGDSLNVNVTSNGEASTRYGTISMEYTDASGATIPYRVQVSQQAGGELRQVIIVAPPGSGVSTDQYQFEFVIDGGADDFFVDAPFSSDSKAYISFDEILMQGHVDLNTHVGSQLIIYCIDIGATGEAPIDASGDIEVELN